MRNPVFAERFFESGSAFGSGRMTVAGTAAKAAFLCGLASLCALLSFWGALRGEGGAVPCLLGTLGAFIVALLLGFRPNWSPLLAPVYAGFEGMALGFFSFRFEAEYPGVVVGAVAATCAVLGVMAVLTVARVVSVTERLKAGLLSVTLGIGCLYLFAGLLALWGHPPSFLFGGAIGIVLSLFAAGAAAVSLLRDFETIERGAREGLPSSREWYAAFGLLVTLVWLYVEILRLLAMFRRKR
jgi:uncharacterized YccA/Bax inhibitor family protein